MPVHCAHSGIWPPLQYKVEIAGTDAPFPNRMPVPRGNLQLRTHVASVAPRPNRSRSLQTTKASGLTRRGAGGSHEERSGPTSPRAYTTGISGADDYANNDPGVPKYAWANSGSLTFARARAVLIGLSAAGRTGGRSRARSGLSTGPQNIPSSGTTRCIRTLHSGTRFSTSFTKTTETRRSSCELV
jgi:hypothetical protein